MTMQEMQQAIYKVADAVGGEVQERYRGRGIQGNRCMGVVCNDNAIPIPAIKEGAARGLRGAKMESMGSGFIVYWPGVKADE